jgi:hypothetical protein
MYLFSDLIIIIIIVTILKRLGLAVHVTHVGPKLCLQEFFCLSYLGLRHETLHLALT